MSLRKMLRNIRKRAGYRIGDPPPHDPMTRREYEAEVIKIMKPLYQTKRPDGRQA